MINYTRFGTQGETVVLVHGFLGGAGYWTPVAAGLADRYDVIAVDLPGFGGSAGVAAPDSLAGYAASMLELMDALGVGAFSLLGFSMGGMIAQQAALDHPSRLQSLVLYGTAAVGNLPNRFESWDASIERIEREGVEATADRTAVTWFVDGARHPFYMACREACRGANRRACVCVMRAMQRWSALDRLGSIAAPTLVIVGDRDRSTRPSESVVLWEGIPNARLCVLPDCAHGAHMEAPELFNAVVRRFLDATIEPTA